MNIRVGEGKRKGRRKKGRVGERKWNSRRKMEG